MNPDSVFGSEIFKWGIIPFFILLARVLDVTLGTMRIVFVSREFKYLPSLLGFFEVLIWLFAIRTIMQNLNNVICYIAYAAGFALGNFIGIYIEKRLAIGKSILRIITNKDATELITHLRSTGYGVTSMDAQGVKGKVHVIYLTIERCDFEKITEIIRKFDTKTFYTLEDIRLVRKGIFPMKKSRLPINLLKPPLRFWRKEK